MPSRVWRRGLRWVAIPFVYLAGFFLAYDALVFEPVSPLVIGGCWTMGSKLFGWVRRRGWRTAG